MKNRLALGIITTLAALSVTAVADDGSVTITSPADGATLAATDPHELVYEVVTGPRGDHVHVYVDDAEVGILRQLTGSYTLPALAAGEREICIRVVNRAHVPVGVDGCIKVTVE
jgi:hypothetical protein